MVQMYALSTFMCWGGEVSHVPRRSLQQQGGQRDQGHEVVLCDYSYTSYSCPEMNLIKDKIPVLGLDIIERRSSYYYHFSSRRFRLHKFSNKIRMEDCE